MLTTGTALIQSINQNRKNFGKTKHWVYCNVKFHGRPHKLTLTSLPVYLYGYPKGFQTKNSVWKTRSCYS